MEILEMTQKGKSSAGLSTRDIVLYTCLNKSEKE